MNHKETLIQKNIFNISQNWQGSSTNATTAKASGWRRPWLIPRRLLTKGNSDNLRKGSRWKQQRWTKQKRILFGSKGISAISAIKAIELDLIARLSAIRAICAPNPARKWMKCCGLGHFMLICTFCRIGRFSSISRILELLQAFRKLFWASECQLRKFYFVGFLMRAAKSSLRNRQKIRPLNVPCVIWRVLNWRSRQEVPVYQVFDPPIFGKADGKQFPS